MGPQGAMGQIFCCMIFCFHIKTWTHVENTWKHIGGPGWCFYLIFTDRPPSSVPALALGPIGSWPTFASYDRSWFVCFSLVLTQILNLLMVSYRFSFEFIVFILLVLRESFSLCFHMTSLVHIFVKKIIIIKTED